MILEELENSDGLSVPSLVEQINLTYGQIDKTLKYLSVEDPSPIYKEKTHSSVISIRHREN
jgi:ATP-dependent DNA helicase RecQ